MSEYLVTFRATIPTLFGLSSQSRDEAKIYESDSADEAVKKARSSLKSELLTHGISEYDMKDSGVSLTLVDVKKI